MTNEYSFVLCDPLGLPLAELTTATGKTITFSRNDYAQATCSISCEDLAASALWDTLNVSGIPTLQCYRDSSLVFAGHLSPFQETYEETGLLQLVFRSPFARLVNRYVFGAANWTSLDAGAIAHALLDSANSLGSTGLMPGTLLASKTRTRAYPAGQSYGEAIRGLTNVLDGFDFIERFDVEGSRLAFMDIAPRIGSDRPDARFEYGHDTLANVRSLQRTITPPVNQATVYGTAGLVVQESDASSIATYGLYPVTESRSNVSETQTLRDRAFALLRPKPVRIITFSADPALSPVPWDDYTVGDTVRFYARRGSLEETLSSRVNGFTVVIDDNGYEAFEIPDPQSPEEEMGLRSSLLIEESDSAAPLEAPDLGSSILGLEERIEELENA